MSKAPTGLRRRGLDRTIDGSLMCHTRTGNCLSRSSIRPKGRHRNRRHSCSCRCEWTF